MNERAPYRNSLRSKKMIKMAFLQLIAEKELSKIRIKEITDLADISKGTFYSHYPDIYAVLEEIENENISNMIVFLDNQFNDSLLEDFSPFMIQIFSHIEENKDFYSLLFNSFAATSFLNKMQKVFVDYMMGNKLLLSKLKGNTEAKMFFSFIAIGVANLIQEHYTKENDMAFDDLVGLLNGCIVGGIATIRK